MKTKENNNACVHCGADCGKEPVMWNHLRFCCNGCLTVYQLLNENKLYNYYKLEETPGIKVETTEFGNKYAFLDNEEVKQKLTSFSEGSISKVRFFIPVIHCASCIWLLEHLQKLHSGVKHSFVNFTKKEVDITFDESKITLRQLVELLSSIHYIPDLSQSLSDKKDDKSYKKLLYKIGLAGFVFVNVMTYSLPAYFNGEPLSDKLQSVFSILSYILVIPVALYSGSDYYISAFKNLLKKNISIDLPIALGIIVLFIVTSYEVISGIGPGYCDSLAGLIFFLLVGKWFQSKTYEALSFERNYKSYFPIAVTKINKQVEESILLERIMVDDKLLIRNKELIPADCELLEGDARIDYSFVTGESTPVVKNTGDFIYAGGRQMGGIIRIKVKKEVNQSHLTKLWNQDTTYHKPSDSLKNLSDRISKYFTIIIIAIAIAGFSYWALHNEMHTAIFVFTAVLIVACPCALALSIPFTFGNTMRIFGRKGLYIKNTDVIEKLSHIDAIVFDKTGTLTQPNQNVVEYSGESLSSSELEAVFSLTKQSTHPLSAALNQFFNNLNYHSPEHFVEVAGRGMFGKVNNVDVRIGSEEYVTGQASTTGKKSSTVFISINEQTKGHYTISNQYRSGLSEVLKTLRKQFALFLISGDNDAEAGNLSSYFDREHLLFNQKPGDKAEFIKKLQSKGRTVLMTGDGLNDAGALMQSDVALTVADKAYHFSPASDAVLEAGQFHRLASFIRFTRTSLRIVKMAFIISFFYNIIGISFAISGNLSPVVAAILMPVSSVSVVAFATFVTRLAGQMKLK
ncbi:heavy metal translocating P-type ATPase metal-binding domain-containing protein [Maribellus sp. YY47]|uniref:heavy metal translocating P-type ATPase n=1 Tax=Maribellus sp. YY47 TaxID=2929486 RepID=UPI0020006C95|nr:heavy metal translocating P-type ATPase metal-binding domain-containing protein [Maribellus sp. YY47]MCK3682585.1 heavy metal translocating P-type ATPase metal-binding domain-containing protein [Maribellus sp. YY47]